MRWTWLCVDRRQRGSPSNICGAHAQLLCYPMSPARRSDSYIFVRITVFFKTQEINALESFIPSVFLLFPHVSDGRLLGLLVYLPWGHFTQDRTQALQRHNFQEENYWCYGSEMITPWKWIAFWWMLVAFVHKEKPRGFLKPWTDRTIFQKSTFGKLSPWSASDLDIFHIIFIQSLCTDKAVWGI